MWYFNGVSPPVVYRTIRHRRIYIVSLTGRGARIDRLYPPFEYPAFQHYTVLAPETFQTDIRADPDYLPVVTAAGVLFPEPDGIAGF